MGITSLITDSSGSVVENTWYSPFGEIVSGGSESRFSYEGKEYDDKTEDTDFHFRKYRPDWGRFKQTDTLIQNVYDPQDLNHYSFESNNPYKYIDPTGHAIDPLSIGILILFIGVVSLGVALVGMIHAKEEGDPEKAEEIGQTAMESQTLSLITMGLGNIFGLAGDALNLVAGFIPAFWKSSSDAQLAQNVKPSGNTIGNIRSNIISNAIKDYEEKKEKEKEGSSSGTKKIKKDKEKDPFGIGDLIQRWLEKNPEKKEDLQKSIGQGTSSGQKGCKATGDASCPD